MNARTTVRHYSKFLSRGISKITWKPNPQTGGGCLQILTIGGLCLGFIFILIFEPLGWVIWVATGILLAFAFPILFTFDLYDKFGEKNAASAALLGPVVGCLGFFLFLLIVSFFFGLLSH